MRTFLYLLAAAMAVTTLALPTSVEGAVADVTARGSPDWKRGSPDWKRGSPDWKRVPQDWKRGSPDWKREE